MKKVQQTKWSIPVLGYQYLMKQDKYSVYFYRYRKVNKKHSIYIDYYEDTGWYYVSIYSNQTSNLSYANRVSGQGTTEEELNKSLLNALRLQVDNSQHHYLSLVKFEKSILKSLDIYDPDKLAR